MNDILNKIQGIVTEACITISLNTHRTFPDNQADPIILKNLINLAEKRIHIEYKKDKALVEKLILGMRKLEGSIDHSKNMESLILFINKDIAIYTRLAITVKNSLLISNRFAIRDLVRAQHSDAHYYILLLSMREVHLIEAFNDRPVEEITSPFSVVNLELHIANNKAEQANASRQTHLQREFLNKVDKLLNETIKDDNLPIIICGEESTYFEYLKVADKKERIIGYFNFNHDGVNNKTIHVVEAALPIINVYKDKMNKARMGELEHAKSRDEVETDINNIWKDIKQHRGRTLFVKDNFYMPAMLDHDVITPVSSDDQGKKDVVDDIISEMIEENIKHGGDVAFMSGNELDNYNGLVLTIKAKGKIH